MAKDTALTPSEIFETYAWEYCDQVVSGVVIFIMLMLIEYYKQIKSCCCHRAPEISSNMGESDDAGDNLLIARDLKKIYYKPRKYFPGFLSCCCMCWGKRCTKNFLKEIRANDKVSLSVSGNESCAIVGLNGAGKTTLFDMLTFKTTPKSGKILLEGRNIER